MFFSLKNILVESTLLYILEEELDSLSNTTKTLLSANSSSIVALQYIFSSLISSAKVLNCKQFKELRKKFSKTI